MRTNKASVKIVQVGGAGVLWNFFFFLTEMLLFFCFCDLSGEIKRGVERCLKMFSLFFSHFLRLLQISCHSMLEINNPLTGKQKQDLTGKQSGPRTITLDSGKCVQLRDKSLQFLNEHTNLCSCSQNSTNSMGPLLWQGRSPMQVPEHRSLVLRICAFQGC